LFQPEGEDDIGRRRGRDKKEDAVLHALARAPEDVEARKDFIKIIRAKTAKSLDQESLDIMTHAARKKALADGARRKRLNPQDIRRSPDKVPGRDPPGRGLSARDVPGYPSLGGLEALSPSHPDHKPLKEAHRLHQGSIFDGYTVELTMDEYQHGKVDRVPPSSHVPRHRLAPSPWRGC